MSVIVVGCRPRVPAAVTSSTDGSVEARLDEAHRLRTEGHPDEALARYAELEQELGGSDDRVARWRAIHGWASVQLDRGHHAGGRSRLPEMRAAAAGDPSLESRTSYFAAAVLHRQGDLDQALLEARRAVDKAREAGDDDLELEALGMVATVLSLSGRHREALAIDEEIEKRLRRADPDSNELGEHLNELGIDYRRLGRFDDAVRTYQEALELQRRWGNERWEGITLFNLANVYGGRGEIERALELKLASLDIAERRADSYGLGLLHADLGLYYGQLGDETQAREHFARALEINRAAEQAMGEISALEGLGRLDLEYGHPERAESVLRQAAAQAEEGGYGSLWVTTRAALALCLVELDRGEEALPLAEEALTRAREQGDPNLEIQALEARARVLESLGPAEAPQAYLEAIDLLESWRGRLALGDLRLGIAEPRWGIYEGAIRTLVARGDDEGAFAVSERARARLLLELMAERDTGRAPSTEWSAVAQQVRLLYGGAAGAEDARTPELESELGRLEALEKDPNRPAARHPEPMGAAAVLEALVADGQTVLAFFWGEDEVYGFVLGSGGLRARRMGTVKELQPRVEFFRSVLEEPEDGIDWRPVAAETYRWLISPLGALPVGDLVVIPDGPLARLPFEALLPEAPATPGRVVDPLGVTHAVSYGPSASVLVDLADARDSANPDSVLSLGFGGVEPSLWSRLVPGSSRSAEEDMPLPYAEPEAREVAALFGGDGLALTGRGATLANWLAHRPGSYRYLHLATHAIVSDDRPEETHLLLRDSRLDLRTIRSLELDADLVTLSGCDTALGRAVRGEGTIGLSHAFLGAGTRNVVVSEWQVDDRSSRDFMHRFYGHLREGASAAEALRRTREDLLRENGSADPSRWASFVVMGAGWVRPAG